MSHATWEDLAAGDGPGQARTEYGFIKPDGTHVNDTRRDSRTSHDKMAVRRLGVEPGPTGSWPSPSDKAVQSGHVRYLRIPKERTGRDHHELSIEVSAAHPDALRHAADLVRQHVPEGSTRHGVALSIANVDHWCDGCRGPAHGLTSEQAIAHLRAHLPGKRMTDTVRARALPFGGSESVADAVILRQLDEEDWERAKRRVGLPSDFELHPLELGVRRLLTRPRFNASVQPSKYVRGGLDLHVTPKIHPHIERITKNTFGDPPRPRDHTWYDKRYAHVEHDDTFGPVARLKPDSGLADKIPEKPDDEHMWRGMSHEEWTRAQQRGYIESDHAYNMSNQQSITSFSRHPRNAESYANGFAPNGHGATFHRPAYAVKVLRPAHAKPEQNNDDYLEVGGRIPLEHVKAVYRGRAWAMSAGEHELVPPREVKGGVWTTGSGRHVSSQIGWEKVR